MKRIIFITGTAIACLFVFSCGKSGNPAPQQNNNTGGTPPDNTPKGPEIENLVIVGNITTLAPDHKTVIRATFDLAAGGKVDFVSSGNITGTIHNLDKGTLTETIDDFTNTPRELPSNISSGLSLIADPADTAKNVYLEVTNPAAIDAITKQQIIKRYFLRNDGTPGAGSFGFDSKIPMNKNEANSADFIGNVLNRNDYKLNQ